MVSKVMAKLRQVRVEYRRNKEQKLLNNFVTIHGDRINKPAYEEMKDAQKVMANYVMKNGVGVDIYDAQEAVTSGYAVKPHKDESLAGKLLVKVTNLLNGLEDEKLISADTKKIHRVEKTDYMLFDMPSEGLQYARKTKKTNEDTFLRNLYRNIQEMTEKVTK
ncbi:MAG: hypothetical protein E7Z93_01850 [Cyanobacteria bacterium SIG32]|nr:hypothetical protein [Cyanobacteria bacterium SIG32]